MPCKMVARVKLMVEVELDQPWGEGETVVQVHRRAAQEAMERLLAAMGRARDSRIQIVGKPQVIGTITED